jgi:RNA polymerase sigma-70 factor (ECF subfamily)
MSAVTNLATTWTPAVAGLGSIDGNNDAMDATAKRRTARINSGVRGRAISELDDIDELVKNYRPRLLRFVTFSIGDPDLAETIAQDTLLKAHNARDSFRGDSSINTFLISIALNLVRDQQRTQKFRFWKQFRSTALDVTDVASFVPSGQISPETQLLVKEKIARLYTIIETLSFSQRAVFLMKFTDEMDVQEISLAMGMPVNTVKTHLHRALKTVRRQLGASL